MVEDAERSMDTVSLREMRVASEGNVDDDEVRAGYTRALVHHIRQGTAWSGFAQ